MSHFWGISERTGGIGESLARSWAGHEWQMISWPNGDVSHESPRRPPDALIPWYLGACYRYDSVQIARSAKNAGVNLENWLQIRMETHQFPLQVGFWQSPLGCFLAFPMVFFWVKWRTAQVVMFFGESVGSADLHYPEVAVLAPRSTKWDAQTFVMGRPGLIKNVNVALGGGRDP